MLYDIKEGNGKFSVYVSKKNGLKFKKSFLTFREAGEICRKIPRSLLSEMSAT